MPKQLIDHSPTLKRVLFKIDTGTYYTGLIKVALALKETGRFESVMFFNNDHPSMTVHVADCQKRGLQVINGLPQLPRVQKVQNHSSIQRSPQEQTPKVTKKGRLGQFFTHLFWLIRCQLKSNPLRQYSLLKNKLTLIEQFLNNQHFDILVYGGENSWYDTALYNKVAKQYEIPTVALPQWMAGPREPAEWIFDDPQYSLKPPINRLAGLLWPRWVVKYQGRRLIRLPGQEVIARELLGCAPPLPWVLHSGRTDVIALENRAMFDYGVREGLPRSQLRVVGSIDHDIMARTMSDRDHRRKTLMSEYDLTDNKPLVLSAIPSNDMSGRRLTVCDFKTYNELLDFCIKTINSNSSVNVLFHTHPSATESEVEKMRALGAKIVARPISELIPLADVFIASISSTIQWAIACGLPVVNYDVYRYRYHDYDAAPGVITIEEQKDLIEILHRLSDSAYQQELRERQTSVAHQWGFLDGQAELRIINLFDTLTTTGDRPPR